MLTTYFTGIEHGRDTIRCVSRSNEPQMFQELFGHRPEPWSQVQGLCLKFTVTKFEVFDLNHVAPHK